MRTRLITGAVVAASAALLAGQALAAPGSITIGGVSVSGGTVTATGTAAFTPDAAGAVDVGGTATPFAAAQAAPAGVDLKKGMIQPLADGKGLRFVWQLSALPAAVPPEGVRFNWSFNAGGKVFQLQAKRTNLASVTMLDDAPGHVTALTRNGFFQIRGNCTANYPQAPSPVSGCPNIAFVTGAFDTAKAQVTMDVPYGVVPEIKAGAILTEAQTAGSSIVAGFQAGVSTTATGSFINGWNAYVAGQAVQVATGVADDDPASLAYTTGTLTGTAYTASTAVTDGADTVFVRACEGVTCTYATRAL